MREKIRAGHLKNEKPALWCYPFSSLGNVGVGPGGATEVNTLIKPLW